MTSDETIWCTACGRPLGIFPEDQPDWATGPICGACYQEFNFEDELVHHHAEEAGVADDEGAW
jgi:hypothetical protein